MEIRPSRSRPPVPVFLATTIVLFVFSLSAAESVGFVPCDVDNTCSSGVSDTIALSSLPELGPEVESVSQLEATSSKLEAVLPERIVIPEIDLDLPVQNAPTRDIEELYEYLKGGPVRYIDSARLGEEGNILIFAHTSHLPVVKNQMYKAFNRVPELEPGDTIRISGGGHEYLYSVNSVEQMDIDDPTSVISLAGEGKRLTLVTCDTLTGKSARFVLTADLVGTY